jgi:hypothetical protein
MDHGVQQRAPVEFLRRMLATIEAGTVELPAFRQVVSGHQCCVAVSLPAVLLRVFLGFECRVIESTLPRVAVIQGSRK